MIIITKRWKRGRIVGIAGEGHAEGTVKQQFQRCAAVSILSRTLGDMLGQENKRGNGRFEYRISKGAEAAVAFALRGFETIASDAPDSVRIRSEYVLTVSRARARRLRGKRVFE